MKNLRRINIQNYTYVTCCCHFGSNGKNCYKTDGDDDRFIYVYRALIMNMHIQT